MEMQKTTIARVLPALLLAMASGAVSAAGFQLLEQNASGIGNAYAGSAAVADNASTIYFNPAGMTQLQAREFSGGLSMVKPGFRFSNQGSSSGALTGGTRDAGGWAALPNGYLSWALDKDLYVGVGLGAPFGLVTEYDDGWVGAAQSIKFEIKTYNINPSIAWRVDDAVSIGFGLNLQRMSAEYERVAAVVPAVSTTHVILDADSDAWGWNLGALFQLSPATRLGFSYRSSIEHKLKGDLSVNGPAAGASAALTTGDARATVELPGTLILSATHRLGKRWEILGDISWTGWSSIEFVDIVRTSGALSGATVQTLDAKFRDTWRIALGGNYQLNDAWKLKAGIAYDQTPVRNASTRLTALPDNDRTWFAVGGQWRASKTAVLDLGLAYLYVSDTRIDNDQSAQGRGRVTGEYDSSVWIVGAQYSMAF